MILCPPSAAAASSLGETEACVYSWEVKVSRAAAGFHQEAEHTTSSAAWFKGVINHQPGGSSTSDGKLCLWEVRWLIHSCMEKKGSSKKKNWEKKGKWGRVTIIWSEVAMETDPSSQPLESESHEWIEGDREHTAHTCWQCMHVCVCVCYCTEKIYILLAKWGHFYRKWENFG